ncbi:MAG: hypothetical protein EAZ95_08205, partial [Bacteroidetes bacterium]
MTCLLLCVACLPASLPAQTPEFEWAVEPTLEYYQVYPFKNGLAMVRPNYETCHKFINLAGKEVLPCIYNVSMSIVQESIYSMRKNTFSEELASVNFRGNFGFIDKNGKEVISFKYDDAGDFSESLARVSLNGKWGFIDKTGKEIIPFKYNTAGDFSEGLAVVNYDNKTIIIDKNNKEIRYLSDIVFVYSENYYYSDGLLKLYSYKDEKHFFITKTGYPINSLKYDVAYNFSEGLALTKLNEEFSFINKNGNKVIDLSNYYNANSFSEGLALVKSNGCGFIDKTGKEVISTQFEDAYSFSGGVAWVKVNGKWGIIKNPLIYPPKPMITLLKVGETLRGQPQTTISENEARMVFRYKYDGIVIGAKINGKGALLDFDEKTINAKEPIAFAIGENKVTVSLLTQEQGTHEATFFINRKEVTITHQIHLLSVGISTFQDKKHNLVYADKDARDVADVFRKQQGKGIFKNVFVHTLLNEQATQRNIGYALEDLQKYVEPNDVVVLFFTSHGITVQDKFYLLAHDSDTFRASSCVSFSQINEALSSLHCRVLLLIDACH